jgi:hypothetical protein
VFSLEIHFKSKSALLLSGLAQLPPFSDRPTPARAAHTCRPAPLPPARHHPHRARVSAPPGPSATVRRARAGPPPHSPPCVTPVPDPPPPFPPPRCMSRFSTKGTKTLFSSFRSHVTPTAPRAPPSSGDHLGPFPATGVSPPLFCSILPRRRRRLPLSVSR